VPTAQLSRFTRMRHRFPKYCRYNTGRRAAVVRSGIRGVAEGAAKLFRGMEAIRGVLWD